MSNWPELGGALAVNPTDGCVLDPFATSPPVPVTELAELHARWPHLAIVVFSDFTGRGARVAEFSDVMDGIIVAGREDDPATIRSVVEDSLARALARRVRMEFAGQVPRIEIEALGWAIEHAAEAPDVDGLARGIGRTPESLQRELHAAGAVSARRALLWGRIFRAGQMLGREKRSVTRTALALGYTSDSAFRRAVRDHLGISPSSVAQRGGIRVVMERYLESRTDSD